jgi:uncharacterized protein
MPFVPAISRRTFMQSASLLTAGLAIPRAWLHGARLRLSPIAVRPPLEEFSYADITVASAPHRKQLEDTHAVLMGLGDDSLLKPFREMIGRPAPGDDLGGWYHYDPNYDFRTFDVGFAPAATFGQWVSALARYYAITGDAATRDKVLRLNRLYAQVIAGDFYENNRFPAYCYDKLVLGLIDSHRYVRDPDAYRILERTTDTALPHLPGKAIEHDHVWRPGKDESWTWDESYTMPENLFLAYQRGAGDRYRDLAVQYLDDEYFGPLAEGRSDFAGRHAYSHVNALCSAMQAYLTVGSEKHLRAARNGFDFLEAQSFATGGWGPDETLRAPNSDDVHASLTNTHHSFETPCGSYAHFKLTRYLLRVTADSRYGDSMERVMYNTILGALPLQPDGRTFYYSDGNFQARKVYSDHRWPCCSGTFPQVAADYGINCYFRDARGVYVNLYIPSTLRWTQDGVAISLTQRSAYPFDAAVQFELAASKRQAFALSFRIPAWAQGAALSVNGKRVTQAVTPGHFATVEREWKTGDRIELDLPLTKRLESVDPRHPNTVALLCGPLVLFATTETPAHAHAAPSRTSARSSQAKVRDLLLSYPLPPAEARFAEANPEDSAPDQAPNDTRAMITRQQLLAARSIAPHKWQAETASGALTLLPFTAISDEQYSTYLVVA